MDARAAHAGTLPGLIALAITCLVLPIACGRSSSRGETAASATEAVRYPDRLAPLARPPLDPPIRITASFGEYRHGHFHAGIDFSTQATIGRPVYSPVDGWVERVHVSGAGYGLMLMLHAEDGRSILFGHLDTVEQPLASWVYAIQESTGQYEQDLEPPAHRFPVHVGDRVAGSGDSGAGPPHLHMEVRYGAMAYNPLEFGYTIPDSYAPVLRRATLEPVDDSSYVDRSAAPRTYALGGRADTVVVEGAVRAWLEGGDGVSDPWPRLAPHAMRMEWKGDTVECRFDRVMWDDDMTEADWVYDGSGRVAPAPALALWCAPDDKPMMYRGSGQASGIIRVAPGDPPRTLSLAAGDAAGNWTEQHLVLRPPRENERGPGMALTSRRRGRRGRRATTPGGAGGLEVMPVAGAYVRLSYGGAPAGVRDVRLGFVAGPNTVTRPASFDGRRWSAVVRAPAGATELVATSAFGSSWDRRMPVRLAFTRRDAATRIDARSAPGGSGAAFSWDLPPGGVFAASVVVIDSVGRGSAIAGLEPLADVVRIGPGRLPLRHAATMSFEKPADASARDRAGVYYERNQGWAWGGAETRGDSIRASIRALGRFGLFADRSAPRVGIARTARQLRGAAHERWSLRCSVVERGSGIDPARTYFTVDGRRVPSEWVAERALLRWRPLDSPARGTHHYEILATDHAGNIGQGNGGFVVR